MNDHVKYTLDESEIPKAWYNIAADLPAPPVPPLHPGTGQPIGPDDLAPLFPMALIQQEVSAERWIEIPDPVRDVYRQWRVTPMHRARRLEKALGTPAKIYYKYEGTSPSGSHKPNTAVPQAFYNKEAGVKRISTETGAGQWGSSMAFAGALFGIQVKVYMVKISFNQKPYRKALMQAFGAECVASPSNETESGRAILAADPNSPGSLGIAISEAVEVAAKNDDTKYALGSVLNHVLLHQTVIGLEALKQMEVAGDYPDVLIGCAGGGSNFAGLVFPFIGEQLRGGKKVRAIACEPSACPTLTRGKFAYDFGDTGHLTPLVKMHTLGSTFIPPAFHAGGLRYHGMAPLVSHLQEARSDRGQGVPPAALLRSGDPVRQGRRHHPGARVEPRGARRHRRGAALQGGGRVPSDLVQPIGTRSLRHGRLHRVLERQPRRSRLRREGADRRARRAAAGRGGLRAQSRCRGPTAVKRRASAVAGFQELSGVRLGSSLAQEDLARPVLDHVGQELALLRSEDPEHRVRTPTRLDEAFAQDGGLLLAQGVQRRLEVVRLEGVHQLEQLVSARVQPVLVVEQLLLHRLQLIDLKGREHQLLRESPEARPVLALGSCAKFLVDASPQLDGHRGSLAGFERRVHFDERIGGSLHALFEGVRGPAHRAIELGGIRTSRSHDGDGGGAELLTGLAAGLEVCLEVVGDHPQGLLLSGAQVPVAPSHLDHHPDGPGELPVALGGQLLRRRLVGRGFFLDRRGAGGRSHDGDGPDDGRQPAQPGSFLGLALHAIQSRASGPRCTPPGAFETILHRP